MEKGTHLHPPSGIKSAAGLVPVGRLKYNTGQVQFPFSATVVQMVFLPPPDLRPQFK